MCYTWLHRLCVRAVMQMGHSSFGRGAPHVCYMQLHDQGVFYSRADQQQQQQQSAWGRFATSVSHKAAGILQSQSSRGASLLAAAAAAAAGSSSSPEEESTTPASTGGGGDGPQWHVVVLQGLALAAALLVAGLLLKHWLRGVVAALVACYSGLPFKV